MLRAVPSLAKRDGVRARICRLFEPSFPFRTENLEGAFVPVYEGQGIGGYDLKSASDRACAFDYDHSGRPDHLLLYQPGAGLASILKNAGGTFRPVYQDHGIAGYDLLSADHRAFTFDYDHTGKLDDVVHYRPGAGIVPIARIR
jgi:hypothetical protein